MIKIKNIVTASPEQIAFVIQGMRNPMNSWDMTDSIITTSGYAIGEKDLDLMRRLCEAGTDHRKFMRMLPTFMRITAPLYWWKEFDTYKVGTVSNSTSTMHKIQAREFTFYDFSYDHLLGFEDNPFKVSISSDGTELSPVGHMGDTISMLNGCREKYLETKDKKYWWQMIQLLPSSYNQTRNVMLNYEVLANIYHSRKNHKLDEWREFCKMIESLPHSELIVNGE